MNTVKNLFSPSLDFILAGLNRLIAKLERHAEKSLAKAASLREAADAMHSLAGNHEGEADQAARVAEKVKALVA